MKIRYHGQDWHIVKGAIPNKDIRIPFSVFLRHRDAQLQWCKETFGERGKCWRYQVVRVPKKVLGKYLKCHFFMFKDSEDAIAFSLRWM